MISFWKHPWVQGLGFGLISAGTVCFTFWFGDQLWPYSLPAWAQHIFWPASAINLVGLLWLGWRFFPWIWVSAPIVALVFGEPLVFSFVGATGNVLEALVGYLIVRKLGRVARGFDHTRSVLALMAASFIAPIPGTIVVPFWLFVERKMDFSQFGMAIWNWSFSNGTALILLSPLLLLLLRRPSVFSNVYGELLLWVAGVSTMTFLTCGAAFLDQGKNFVFLVFPVFILVAVKLGPQGAAAAGAAVMGSVYAALVFYASRMVPEHVPAAIWFTQAFCWVLAATGLLVAALVAERQLAQRYFVHAKARALAISLKEERARLDALRYQMNPHFLFNALNSLRATLPASNENSRKMVTELAGYMRATLSDPADNFSTVGEEMTLARQYLAIEQQRFPEDLKVVIAVAEGLEEQRIPIFLLQPLIENAITHSLAVHSGIMNLHIDVRVEKQHLKIEVANTGIWRTPDPSRRHLGVDNIRHRLQLMYGKEASLKFQIDQNWVRALIEIPYNDSTCAV